MKSIHCIEINEFSATPKYQQVVNSVITSIRKDNLKVGDLLPSINEVSFEFDVSRLTVEKGYNELRKMGIVQAIQGKGYFIASTSIKQNLRILLLFNKLSAHKKIIYDAFVKHLPQEATIDFYVYNNDYTLFKRLLDHPKENYTHYVIIPHFSENERKALQLIDELPKGKLILVGKKPNGISGEYRTVYENFEKDIYHALTQALSALRKYHTLKIIFPENSYSASEIVKGFVSFCRDHAFQSKIVHSDEFIGEGELYITLTEEDLVQILEKVIALEWTLGKQIGLISYNETPLKKFIMNGITTISTDFERMGTTAANLVLSSPPTHVENPFYLTLRASI
ncbi:MAG: GntR family transcriptional regulator [Thermoflexibacter sp.]